MSWLRVLRWLPPSHCLPLPFCFNGHLIRPSTRHGGHAVHRRDTDVPWFLGSLPWTACGRLESSGWRQPDEEVRARRGGMAGKRGGRGPPIGSHDLSYKNSASVVHQRTLALIICACFYLQSSTRQQALSTQQPLPPPCPASPHVCLLSLPSLLFLPLLLVLC